jgi:hypothetical protein
MAAPLRACQGLMYCNLHRLQDSEEHYSCQMADPRDMDRHPGLARSMDCGAQCPEQMRGVRRLAE